MVERPTQECEREYRSLLGAIPDAIVMFDTAGRVVVHNAAAERLLGLTPPETAGGASAAWELAGTEFVPDNALPALVSSTLASGRLSDEEIIGLRSPDGEVRWLSTSTRPVLDADGEVAGVVVSARDVTAARSNAAEGASLLSRLRALFEHLPVGIFETDPRGTCARANRAWSALTGLSQEECHQLGWIRAVHPHDKISVSEEWSQAVAEGRPFRRVHRYERSRGEVIWAVTEAVAVRNGNDEVVGFVGTVSEVSDCCGDADELLRREARSYETERLQSLATLAGGVAHDFNNLLTVVLGAAHLARQQANPKVMSLLDQVEEAARRAAELSGLLMDYSGGGMVKSQTLDLSALVRDMTPLLRSSVPLDMRVVVEAEGTAYVTGDPTRLKQVVLNLVLNAVEAMPGEGTVTVAVEEREIDRAWLEAAQASPELSPGRHVSLTVRDCGKGIAPAALSRVFDPFFTTKATGRGLGLASALGIVKAHDGAVGVETSEAGTTFTVVLPQARPPQPVDMLEARARPADHEGIVLVVDDQEGVRALVAQTLRGAGYAVEEAATAEEGLVRALQPGLLAIVLDLTMPGMSGGEMLQELRAAGLMTPVVLMSGYSEDHARGHLGSAKADQFLQKPFRVGELLAVLGEAITAS